MSGRKNLVAFGASDDGQSAAEGTEAAADAAHGSEVEAEPDFDQVWDEEVGRKRPAMVLPALAIVAVFAWTAFFVWVHHQAIAQGASPAEWAGWIVDWAIPVLLVVALWSLAMRNSTREADRFGETARLLSAESSSLEKRLGVVNRELSLARDFIASQSRDLESLGRVASERLSANADRLQELIRANGEQVNVIGSVSDTALANMDRLRDQLPVVSNAARDVASQIGNAGNTAQGQLDEMISGFARLNDFGEANGRQIDNLRIKVSETLAGFELNTNELDRLTKERFEALQKQNDAFRLELEARETDALSAIRRRAEMLSAELTDMDADNRAREDAAIGEMRNRMEELRDEGLALASTMRSGQDEAKSFWNGEIEQLQARMAEAIAEISRIDEAAINNARQRLQALAQAGNRVDRSIIESADAFDAEFAKRRDSATAIEAEALAALEARIGNFDQQVAQRQQDQVTHLSKMMERTDALAARIAELDGEISRLAALGSDDSDRLGEKTEFLASRLSQSRAILEESGTFVSRLTDDSIRMLEIIRASSDHSEGILSDSIGQAEARLNDFESKASALRATIADAEQKGSALFDHITRTSELSATSAETLGGLEVKLASLAEHTKNLAEQARWELHGAIGALETASSEAVSKIHSDQSGAVREIAERIGSEGSEALEKALREGAQTAIAELELAAQQAGEHGRAAAKQLRDQLAKVNELTGNLEQRVAQAREQAEEKIDTDFSRRMALITEALNSSSIDIARALDAEVTDTAWASYLRGDRGVFTRRAVRLLDNREARAVSEVYEEDGEIREAINRYIHDFEAMLRTVLSTRDGNAMAVTLLSSDMGKLYVALAQAIERLRH